MSSYASTRNESNSNVTKIANSIVDDRRLWKKFKEEVNESNIVTNGAVVTYMLQKTLIDQEKNRRYRGQNEQKKGKMGTGTGGSFLFLRHLLTKSNCKDEGFSNNTKDHSKLSKDNVHREIMKPRRSLDILRAVFVKNDFNEVSGGSLNTNLREDESISVDMYDIDKRRQSKRPSGFSFLTLSSMPSESSITLASDDPYLSEDAESSIINSDVNLRKLRKFPSTHSLVGLSSIEQQIRDMTVEKND